jgi:NADH-quinone oxidoreductase subunit C
VTDALLQVNSPTWGEPDHGAADRLEAALGAGVVERRVEHRGELTLDVPVDRLPDVCRFLRDEEGYDLLSDVTGVDYLGYEGEVAGYWSGGADGRDLNRSASAGKRVVPEPAGPKRFAVATTLAKVMTVADGGHRRLRVRVWVDDGESVPTLVPVYPSADFHEREAFDLLGIEFEGHPNLRRILMPEWWGGHPQRKDYPIGGEPVQFSDEA